MGNRILKESICSSDNIDLLTAFQETMFYRLIVNCDDYGRMDARPKLLASKLYPLKDVKPAQIAEGLNALVNAGLIVLYTVEGKPYLQMATWEKHQRIRNSVGKYPAPSEGQLQQVAASCGELPQDEETSGEMRPESNTNPIRIQSNTNTNSAKRERAHEQLALFEKFWEKYPRKAAKQDAVKAWGKLKADETLLATILAALDKQVPLWDEPQFIPFPATWLNGHRWEDEPTRNGKVRDKPTQSQYSQRTYEERKPTETPEWLAEMLAEEAAQ